MGMAASQARLLSLTARLSDLEYSAQSISNRRVELATSSEEISQKYADALDVKKLTIKTGYNDGNAVYQDMSYSLLTSPSTVLNAQYGLSDSYGRLVVTKDMESKFKSSSTPEAFVAACGVTSFTESAPGWDVANQKVLAAQAAFDALAGLPDTITRDVTKEIEDPGLAVARENYANAQDETLMCQQRLDEVRRQNPNYDTRPEEYDYQAAQDRERIALDILTSLEAKTVTVTEKETIENPVKTEAKKKLADATVERDSLGAPTVTNGENFDFYNNIYARMQKGYISMEDEASTIKDPDWIYQQMNGGNLHLEAVDKTTKEWKDSSWQTNTDLIEKDDDNGLAVIKAKFDVQMEEIQNKDKMLELSLKRIDTEHNALQTESETIIKVINKNVERSFKTFG